MQPSKRYLNAIKEERIILDPSQEAIILKLDELYLELIKQTAFLPRIMRICALKLGVAYNPIKGIYLWGGVGGGKTFLIDLFYHSLSFKSKKRIHFHQFMQYVHGELTRLKGTPNPLKLIAKRLALHYNLICFDELFVKDIGDAMMLGPLFNELFKMGVTLVITSNLKPESLYHNGLQREQFLPTIHAINCHCNIIQLNNGVDYRMRYLEKNHFYHYPLNELTNEKMMDCFKELALGEIQSHALLTINSRHIQTMRLANNCVWFDFSELCKSYRSTLDYIEIAESFQIVLISNLNSMDSNSDDVARRFINLVDELYEKKVSLIISANVTLDTLYQGVQLKFEFNRTISRLTEMQSARYNAQPHLS